MESPQPYKRNATYGDLYEIPETWVGQLIDGDLWAFPRPASGHALAVKNLNDMLVSLSRDRGAAGWVLLADVEIRIGDDLLVPDIAGWRRQRMPIVPETTVFDLAPDWVGEVFSPSTRRLDRGRKRDIYARGGVDHLWWIDPLNLELDVLTRSGDVYQMQGSIGTSGRSVIPPFGIELDIEDLWRR